MYGEGGQYLPTVVPDMAGCGEDSFSGSDECGGK